MIEFHHRQCPHYGIKQILFYFSVTFTIIGFIAPKALYCTTPDWITSLKHSTPFCTISGKQINTLICIVYKMELTYNLHIFQKPTHVEIINNITVKVESTNMSIFFSSFDFLIIYAYHVHCRSVLLSFFASRIFQKALQI